MLRYLLVSATRGVPTGKKPGQGGIGEGGAGTAAGTAAAMVVERMTLQAPLYLPLSFPFPSDWIPHICVASFYCEGFGLKVQTYPTRST